VIRQRRAAAVGLFLVVRPDLLFLASTITVDLFDRPILLNAEMLDQSVEQVGKIPGMREPLL
jgi:hypothetical protein